MATTTIPRRLTALAAHATALADMVREEQPPPQILARLRMLRAGLEQAEELLVEAELRNDPKLRARIDALLREGGNGSA